MNRTGLLSFLLAAVFAGRIPAQTPLGPEFVVADPSFSASFQTPEAQGVACDAESVCVLVWHSAQPDGVQNHERIWAASYDRAGALLARKVVSTADTFGGGIVGVALDRGFALLWDRMYGDGSSVPVLRLFDEDLEAQGGAIALPFHGPSEPGDASSYGATFAVVHTANGYVMLSPAYVSAGGRLGVFLYFVDPEGHQLRERVAVNQYRSDDARLPQPGGGLAQDPAGNLIVTYYKLAGGQNGPWDVYLRRFSPSGEPLGPELRVNTYRKGAQWYPQVAVSPDGQFLVVWQSKGEDGSDDGIYARLYSKEGWWLTPEFRVNDLTFSAQRFPHVAADAFGNYFVGWSSFPAGEVVGWEVKGKFYRHDLTPIGGEFRLNEERLYDQILAQAAFTPDGTLFALWSSSSPRQTNGEGEVPVARRFAVTPP